MEPELLVQDVAARWPEAVRPGAVPGAAAPPASPPTPAAPPAVTAGPGEDRPADRVQEESRDRMIRGGGSRSR